MLPEVGLVDDDLSLVRLTAREAMGYFTKVAFNGGLVRDSARPGSPCSIAACGFAAAAYVAARELGIVGRDEAKRRCLAIVRRVLALPMAETKTAARTAAGYRGWFYHFLKAEGQSAGEREWRSELSTIDTALLLAGLLIAAAAFDEDDADAAELRAGVATIYDRVDFPFMLRQSGRLSHGWRPEAVGRRRVGHGRDGFIGCEWDGYSEGLLLYLLALGSDTFAISPDCYAAWCATYPRDWATVEGVEHLHCPPLFAHQFPHAFVDLRGVQDAFMRERGLDYVENARRATLAQVRYATRNPRGFDGYGPTLWGLSASNGPGIEHAAQLRRDGRRLKFHGYVERGLAPPDGVVDDGTLAPWAAAASLPFLPTEVLASIRAHRDVTLCKPGWSGFLGSYNLTYLDADCPHGWVDEHDLAIEQAPIAMMVANHLCDGIWRHARRSGPIVRGLRRAGFRGGWLDG